jgi:hypothetical protein
MRDADTLYADKAGGPNRWETFWYGSHNTKRFGRACYGKDAVIVYSKTLRFGRVVFVGDEVIALKSW